jgi:hypothetical protein
VEKKKIMSPRVERMSVARTERTGRMIADGQRRMTNRNWKLILTFIIPLCVMFVCEE